MADALGGRVPIPPDQDLGQTDFSTTIEADQLIVADRSMTWAGDEAYGSVSETAVTTPALRWFLAEGATHGGFDLFYLLQNANSMAASVRIRYLLPSGEVVDKDYIVQPQSRTTVYVDTEDIPGRGPALAATDVSAIIEVTNNQPIIVERSMYFSTSAQAFAAGHVSVAVPEPSTTWFLAEGATGAFFDMFPLFANPTATTAQVETQYLLSTGAVVTKVYPIAPFTRVTKNVSFEDPLLADAAVSVAVRVQNDVPIIVERSTWWPHVRVARCFVLMGFGVKTDWCKIARSSIGCVPHGSKRCSALAIRRSSRNAMRSLRPRRNHGC